MKNKRNDTNEPKFQKYVKGAYDLSLGISIIVAILLGVALGILLKKFFDSIWLLWLGIGWGVGAALLNIYKAYKAQKAELDELAKDPRYQKYTQEDEDEE